MLFDVERTILAGRPGLTVRGELDLSTSPELGAAIEAELAAAPHGLVVDLSFLAFLDSSGARELVQAARSAEAADVPLHVICPRSNRAVRLPIDLLDLGTFVPLVESAADIAPDRTRRDASP